MSKERNSALVLGLLAGAAIGSLLGVLFAPEKGCETRKRIKRKAEDLTDEAFEHYEHFTGVAKDNVDKFLSAAKDGYQKYRGEVIEKTEELKKDIKKELDA